LIAPKAPDVSNLSVIDRRLHVKSDGAAKPYQASDFVLLSITGGEARGDENQLPFYPLKTEALAALWDGEGGIERAKGNLIAAYQQMRKSADMTALEAGRLFDSWLKEFEEEKKRLAQTRSLPVKERHSDHSTLVKDLNEASHRLAQLG